MRFLCIGAGAVGAYVGGSLAAAGHPVTFLLRPAAAEALRAHGLQITQSGVTTRVQEATVTTSPVEALATEPAILLFALKAYDTAAALDELRPFAAWLPPVLCLQNGIGNEDAIASVVGDKRVIAGTVTTAVSRAGPGQIVVERKRGVGLALGHPLSETLVETFNRAGLNARAYPAAEPVKWSKLLTNMVGNATSAILDMTVAEVFGDARLFALERAALRECLAVMHVRRYPIVDLPGTPVRALVFGLHLPPFLGRPLLQRAVASGRGGKMPSFHTDLRRGRRQTEVRWLNGAVVRAGAERGIPTRINQGLTDIVEAISDGRANLEEFRRRPESLLKRIVA
jgi:2-dehydropantoate 2-reductase